MSSFAVLILAAGFSRRIGKFKPLLSIGGVTFVDRLIAIFQQNDVEVYLVIGFHAEELKTAIREHNVVVVENPDYRLGMFASVQAGVRALKQGCRAFFVIPVDIPLVRSLTIRQIITASTQYPDKIIYPVFNQKRGHPVLIPVSLAPTISRWCKDGSLRDVLHSFENLSLEVNVPDENILLDINTTDDYNSVIERFQSRV